MLVEFARDLALHFNCWCRAVTVETFQTLCYLIVLEQFKQAVPENITIYINELYFDRPRFSRGQPQTFRKPQRMELQGNGNVGYEVCH